MIHHAYLECGNCGLDFDDRENHGETFNTKTEAREEGKRLAESHYCDTEHVSVTVRSNPW